MLTLLAASCRASGPNGERVETFRYDPRGNLVHAEVAEGAVRQCVGMRWDDADRPTLEVLLGEACEVPPGALSEAHGIATVYGYHGETGLLAELTVRGAVNGTPQVARRTAFEHDAWNRVRLERLTGHDEQDHVTEFLRDGLGHVVGTRDPAGHWHASLRDPLGRVTVMADASLLAGTFDPEPVQRWTSVAYHPDGRPAVEKDPYGSTMRWVLDGVGDRVVAEVESGPGTPPLSRTTSYADFDGLGNPRQVTDAGGVTWHLTFSPRLEVVSLCPDAPEADGACREMEYLLDGSLVRERDMDGHETIYAYDVLGRIREMTDPLQRVTRLEWVLMDHVSAVEDNRGWRTETRYDAWGRVQEVLEGRSGQLTRTSLQLVNALDEVLEVHDARGAVTRMTYDGRGLLTEMELPAVDGQSAIEVREYDTAGHLRRVTDPDGVTMAYEVDAVGRVLAEVLAPQTPEEARTSYTYDAVGQLVEMVRPRHQGATPRVARRMEWDAFGRLSQVVDEAENATHYTWDLQDQLLEVWEGPESGADTLASFYTYTQLGQLTRHTQRVGPEGPALVTEWLDHSPEGLVGRVRTARGDEVVTYDAVGRPLASEVSPLSGVDSDTWAPTIRTWDYDDDEGEVLLTEKSTDPLGAEVTDITHQVYDPRGWLRRESVTRAEGQLEVTFDYDANGNRTRQTTTGFGLEERTDWVWDAQDRLQSLVTPGGESRWTYSPGGRPERIDFANETRAAFQYEEHTGRLRGITHREGVAGSAAVMASVNYTYDVNGNRASQELSIGGNTETTTYTYDAVDQLRSFSVLPGAGSEAEPRHTWYGHERYRRVYEGRCRGGEALVESGGTFGFECQPTVTDGEGNVIEQGGVRTMASTLTYDGLHGQISQVSNALASHSAGEGPPLVTYDHDAAGNLVERRTLMGTDSSGEPIEEVDLFRYNALDQLVEVARGPPGSEAVVGQYAYNVNGLRTRVRESGRNADAWYDGLSLLMERVEEDGSSGQGDPWMNTVRYHHDPGGLHAITADHDGPDSRSTHFAHRDGIGSTLAVSRPVPGAGGVGLVAASWRTDPWGLVTAETGVDHVNASIFTGHQHDFDTGLIYMRARFYDPALGRFLSADSWLGDAENPPSLQRYLYAYGNPGVWWDPTGRFPQLPNTYPAEGSPGIGTQYYGNPYGWTDEEAVRASFEYGFGGIESVEEAVWSLTWLSESMALSYATLGVWPTVRIALGEPLAPMQDGLRSLIADETSGSVTARVGRAAGLDPESNAWTYGWWSGTIAQVLVPAGWFGSGRTASTNAAKPVQRAQREASEVLHSHAVSRTSTPPPPPPGAQATPSVGSPSPSAAALGPRPAASAPSPATQLPPLPAGYHYRTTAGGAIHVSRNPGQRSLLPKLRLENGQLVRVLDRSTFRENFALATGRNPAGYHAHHNLPVKFEREFRQAGIRNIHEPRFGALVRPQQHLREASDFNAEWNAFFQSYLDADTFPSASQVLAFGRKVARQYGYQVRF